MLRPIAACGLSLGLALALLASQGASAQTAPARGDCISNGMVQLGAFLSRPVSSERGGETNLIEYTVTLRATQPLRIATVSLRSGTMPGLGIEVELPVGQEVRVMLGQRPGPRLSDSELRSSLRVTCMPA